MIAPADTTGKGIPGGLLEPGTYTGAADSEGEEEEDPPDVLEAKEIKRDKERKRRARKAAEREEALLLAAGGGGGTSTPIGTPTMGHQQLQGQGFLPIPGMPIPPNPHTPMALSKGMSPVPGYSRPLQGQIPPHPNSQQRLPLSQPNQPPFAPNGPQRIPSTGNNGPVNQQQVTGSQERPSRRKPVEGFLGLIPGGEAEMQRLFEAESLPSKTGKSGLKYYAGELIHGSLNIVLVLFVRSFIRSFVRSTPVELLDSDPKTDKVLWFSGPPIDIQAIERPKHSAEYLTFLAMKKAQRVHV